MKRIQVTGVALGLALIGSALVGAGVAAQFSDRAEAYQVITVGEIEIVLSSSTEGARIDGNTLVCPPVHIVESTGGIDEACDIKVESVGDIEPSAVTLSVRAQTDGADLSKFGVDVYTSPSGWDTDPGYMTLSDALQYVGSPADPLSSEVVMRLGWGFGAPFDSGPLTASDMGKTVTVVYVVDAVE